MVLLLEPMEPPRLHHRYLFRARHLGDAHCGGGRRPAHLLKHADASAPEAPPDAQANPRGEDVQRALAPRDGLEPPGTGAN